MNSNEPAVRQADRHIRYESTPKRCRKTARLDNLPYDILLLLTRFLGAIDVSALSKTCKYLHQLLLTRPVFTGLAMDSLKRCRPLPLSGFHRIRDLSTDQLIQAVMKAAVLEDSWSQRAPRRSTSYYREAFPDSSDSNWYRILHVPSVDPLEWLSPLTTAYNVFMTKSGKVVCWDQQRDQAVAEWQSEEPSLLWKCRLAYETRTTFFAIMKLPEGDHTPQDERTVTRFDLIKLQFPPPDADDPPAFAHVTNFQMTGHPFNLFLLDPSVSMLGGFVWLSSNSHIALYILHNWETGDYTFIDTEIEWSNSATWSCYLHDKQIVIHSESEGHATEYFYPLSDLRRWMIVGSPAEDTIPTLLHGISPPVSRSVPLVPWLYQAPVWYPDSVHYVRQWWPALPGIASLCNAVTLLVAENDNQSSSPMRYVLSQHYFEAGLPPAHPVRTSNVPSHTGTDAHPTSDSRKLCMSYVSTPFDIAFTSTRDEQADNAQVQDATEVPLIATDFGHAVWIEDVETGSDSGAEEAEPASYSGKLLRFVTFPPVSSMWKGDDSEEHIELTVHTLETPAELKLHEVNNICLDQSQGTVTLSVGDGRIFVLYYE